MKHTLTVTLVLISFFILSQVVGLWLINKESHVSFDKSINETVVTFNDTAVGPRPETTGSGSLIYVLIAIFIGTMLVLLIVKYGKVNIWKTWFFFAVWMTSSVSIGAIIKTNVYFQFDIAIFIALLLTIWKLFKPNILIHNITEVLKYAGIGLILVPIFDVTWAIVLLVIISIYDIYAVWHSKHMVKMAEFQTQSKVFAGLMIPYTTPDSLKPRKQKNVKMIVSKGKIKVASGPKTAILGGGDIAFPLIFSGTVMNGLLLEGMSKSSAFLHASIITLTTTIALGLLFMFAKKDKFYPAMPFVTAGCLIGWAIILLIGIL